MGNQFEDVKTIRKGETPTFRMTARSEITGQPIDFTGAALTFMVKAGAHDLDTAAIVSKAAVASEPKKGKATVKLGSVDTDRLGEFYAELKADYGNDTIIRPIQFVLRIGLGIHDV